MAADRLNRARSSVGFVRGLALAAGLAAPTVSLAQADDQVVPVLDLPREGYEQPVRQIGPFAFLATADARMEYDNNVYAQNLNRTDDVLVTVKPAVRMILDKETLVWTTDANASVYRYFDQTSENHEGFALTSKVVVNHDRFNFGVRAGFERTFENRNDPEARRLFGTGPRLFNVASAEAFAAVEGNRVGLRAQFNADRYNFLSSNDDERDFTSYQAMLRARFRVSPIASVFATGYANWRDFRLSADRSGVNRDALSTGALVGVEFDPGGKLRGEMAVGVVNFDPRMSGLPGYTGFAARGSLVYNPRVRTAITLDVFRGDVATVRLGATGRVDTRVRLGVQQEAYHNVLLSGGVGYRRTQYRGVSGQQQSNWSADGEVEYLMNRHTSIALNARFLKRNVSLSPLGNAPGEFIQNGQLRSADAFSRFRAGVEVRFKF